jgi:hypothetical protein
MNASSTDEAANFLHEIYKVGRGPGGVGPISEPVLLHRSCRLVPDSGIDDDSIDG